MTTATRPESFEQKPHESLRRLSGPGPIDVLWGMGIVVTFVTLLSAIVITNAAFFYVRFKDAYDASHEMASWPLTMVALVSHLVGVPIFIYQYQFSVYRITLLGSVLTPLGLLASALAPNIGWITFTIGFIYGSGLGILMICLSIYTMDYFDQYRGTVSGLKYLGWSASGLVFPVILSALVDIYGLQGTLFLSGGLVLNIVPIVFLLRKPTHTMTSRCCGFRRDFRRNITSKTRLLHEDSSLSQGYTIDTGTLAEPKCQGIAIDTLRMYPSNWRTEDTLLQSAFHGGESVPGSKWEQENSLLTNSSPKQDAKKGFAEDHSCSGENAEGASVLENSVLVSTSLETPPQTQLRGSSYCKEDNGIDNYKRRALFGRLTFMLQRRFSLNQDLGNSHRTSHIGPLKEVQSILQTPAVYALSSTYVIFEYCHIVATTNIVAYAVDKGSPLPIAESLIMYGAVASMTGRIVLPVASDTLGLKRDLLVVGNLLAVSLCFALLPEVSSFLHVVILLVGEGVASGAVLAMKPVIVAEYLGVEKMTATWGIMGVFMVPVFLASPYIIGFFRDGMGSFDNLYRLHAALNFFVAMILLALACQGKCRRPRDVFKGK